ncbi:PP0621 family protein [Pseudoduganella sp. SL102]|uniref:Preprotein translocase subunit YajC n=1 Tax=Pseudoduganella albidiflava TaxID=321983 RepID=A0A411WSZ1_9BURK|nr:MULTISPECIES: PP0621 family protein [Pseudoduganella]QBH99767.1 hypothetical protein EYF70_02110 [Pseudoduganella albidiflava]WBS02239.1 PP0621 family protein [Pseudoduganella sp. SL102]GGY62933.1 hypothetical protein GCM10007387_51750 [Pseudoduganella albidiflava]
MTRILFWLALALLVYFAIRSKLKASQRRQQQQWEQQQREQQRQANASTSRQVTPPEAMLCCAHCGVHFPASENVPANGRDYCSPAHAPLK